MARFSMTGTAPVLRSVVRRLAAHLQPREATETREDDGSRHRRERSTWRVDLLHEGGRKVDLDKGVEREEL
jgi:hypothetical protein